jgi:hypothetical protein
MVQGYTGAKLPDDQVTYLWSNPHLMMSVDRDYAIPEKDVKKLHKIELRAGHHAVEVRCLYTRDVTYHAKEGDPPSSTPVKESFTASPVIAVVMSGDATRQYKPRVHFERNVDGVPGCRVKMFDVTEESGGQDVHLF